MTGKLLAVVLFGSVARGDDDETSDLDILAIVESRAGRVDEEIVYHLLPTELRDRRPDISWYGSDRYREMSLTGQLFAWHIYLDGRVLFDPQDYMRLLGAPTPYTKCLEDIDAFIAIADGIRPQILASSQNAVYEMGVLYVCLRNVAMSGSWFLAARPDFTRDAPFHLSPSLSSFGVSHLSYRRSMACRQASQRGADAPGMVSEQEVLKMVDATAPWMALIRSECARIAECN